MKTMMMADFLAAKKYLLSQFLMSVVLGIFIGVVMGNVYSILPVVTILIPFSLTFTLFTFDERNNWQQFRLMLPLSRSQAIVGRYAGFALLVVASAALGFIVFALFCAFAQNAPFIPGLLGLLEGFSWQAVALSGAAAFGLMFSWLSLLLPLNARFGLTKGVRYAPMLIFLTFPFVVLLENSDFVAPQFMLDFAAWVQTDAGTGGLCLVIVGVVAILYATSCALSIKLYAKREL